MVKFAVLGCGRIGRMHALNLARHLRAELAYVYDVVPATAAAVADATGARQAGAIEEILDAADVQAVLIASSTDTHLDLLVRAVEAGKAVLCEKPIDLDLAKVDASWARIQARGATIMVGFNRRFDASFKALRERIAAGEIGKLEQVIITSRDPGPPPVAYIKVSGGLFRDMTIHDFDLARYLMGDIAAVHAICANLVDPAIEQASDIDAAMITLVARSGALCQISNSRRSAYGYDQRIEAFGEKGMLQAGNQRPTTVSFWGAAATDAKDPVLNFFIERYTPAYLAEIDHFIDCVENGSAPLVGYGDGREALRLADAALESMRTGQTIRLE
jgi:myo-inositol 2-dehydrogenase / D-chiro-inositol 1-dehydrogenase